MYIEKPNPHKSKPQRGDMCRIGLVHGRHIEKIARPTGYLGSVDIYVRRVRNSPIHT